jgi:hypothetical protein
MAPIIQPRVSTVAQEARQFFLDHVRGLPGVVKAEVRGDVALSDPTFVVHVPQGDVETEKRVYELKMKTYERFPDAHLDVWIEEVE